MNTFSDWNSDTSSDNDTPAPHFATVRLSDIGQVDRYGNHTFKKKEVDSQTQENREQLKAALKQIDGSPSRLEKAIDHEQRKSLFGKTSILHSSKLKRPPPRPPTVTGEGDSSYEFHNASTAGKPQKENRPPPLPPRKGAKITSNIHIRRPLEIHPVDYTTIFSPDSITSARYIIF